MLKLFRQKNVAKMVLWGLLILILPAFVLWGTGSLSGMKNKGPKFVGIIHGRKVSFADFANSVMDIRCQLILNYYNQPKVLDALINNKPFMGQLAWDRLIMLSEAKSSGMRVSDKEVIAYIRSLPIFLRDGRFDEKFYDYILRNNLAMPPRSFEEMVRENLQMQRLNDNLTKDVKISDEEVADSYRKEHQNIKVRYVFIPYSNFTDKVAVTDEEIKDYYDRIGNELVMTPKNKESKEAARHATLEEAKATLKSLLLEKKAGPFAIKYADDAHKKIVGLMDKDKLTFEDAAKKLGFEARETPLFTKGSYLEGIGEVYAVSEAAGNLKDGEISGPVVTGRGVMIFKVIEARKIDEEQFKKDMADYTKKALGRKKEAALSVWLKNLETSETLNIDLNDYEKYYS